MNEKDLENINTIDMECSVADEDDSFGGINAEFSDDRDIQRKTGIILDFSDDDHKPIRTISADMTPQGTLVVNDNGLNTDAFHDYNAIDMETNYADDDTDTNSSFELLKTANATDKIFFSDEDESLDDDLDKKELVDSDILDEGKKKRKSITTGEVEADYWEKITKQHKASNTKGAMYSGFRFVGNPEKEMDFFNASMGNGSNNTSDLAAVGTDTAGGSSTASSAGGGSFGESLSESLDKLEPIFDIIGFEVFPNHENSSITVVDTCNMEPDFIGKNLSEILSKLYPYIEDCFIYPLQIKTNQKITTCKDWVDWYSEENKRQFPNCADDINYCALLSKYM